MMLHFVVLLFLAVSSVLGKGENYAGNKVYKIKFDTEKQQRNLSLIQNDNINFWRKPVAKYGIEGLAMVPTELTEWFEKNLELLGVNKNVVIDDVYELLKENESKLVKTNSNVGHRNFDFDAFYRYNEILDHLHALQEEHPNTLELVEAGTTSENRQLAYLKISTTNFAGTKPVIVVEAAINPREWITVPAAINVVNQLHETSNSNLLQNIDWIIVPVVNPDGYEYSHTNLRLWEKNRSTQSSVGFICPGANINRNFDIAWMNVGSSSSPCSDIYAGISAFSEEESKVIKNIFDEYMPRINLYLAIHNEGPFISYPWRYERAASGLFRQHHLLALALRNELASPDSYNIDIGSEIFGERASGTSTDYVQDHNVPYALNIGISQHENNGVVIPEEDIRQYIAPIWTIISSAAYFVLQNV